ncbi:hypothetical protein MtrunA17_Chr2g0318571 [Medicago truncatula]|uniref:Uncharacterized protein n=1 Tax=Medicago truncatula TaxID=3880 RepID=A0A396JA86_MEDTR|nr:hypothetical protein MtrunA17_Chr2g0318571 [Medicago truncatula]
MLIKGNKTSTILSHILYANDVMLFCKGTSSNIHILSEFFARYTHITSQVINPIKSTIFCWFHISIKISSHN